MNLRIRQTSLLVFAGACVAGAVIACSGSDDPQTWEDTTGEDAGTTPPVHLPDQTPDTDDGGTDPEFDAGNTDHRPPFDPTDEAVNCTVTPCAKQLVAGDNHFCARMSDGTIRCWGDNAKGNLGIADAGVLVDGGPVSDGGPDSGTGYLIPTVTGITGATQISAGGTTTCALVADGGVQCWGGNDKAQLGLSTVAADAGAASDTLAHPTPAPVPALTTPATRVDVGARSACAVLTTGEVWCWGDNSQRELARAFPTTMGAPAAAALGTPKVVRTSVGTNTAFGVTDTGALLQWGSSNGAEGAAAGRISSLSPDPIPYQLLNGPVTSAQVSSTSTYSPPCSGFPCPAAQQLVHACAIVKGDVYCWGTSRFGATGTGLPDAVVKPTRVMVKSENGWPQQVVTAGEITCLRLTDGTVQCAGDNSRGALGKTSSNTATYSMLFDDTDFFKAHAVQIAAAKNTVCAIVQGGSVQCWGGNDKGELGQGSVDTKTHPTPVSIGF